MHARAISRDEERAWVALLLLGLVTLAGLTAVGFAIRWRATALPLGGAAGLVGVAHFYRTLRPNERLAATCGALAQLVVMSLAAAALSYLVACLDRPLRDAMLERADRMLGFHWRAWLVAADAHPAFGTLLKLAYDTLMPQMAVVLLALGLGGRLSELRVMVWAAAIGAVTVVLVSALVPAAGYYVHLGLSPADYPHLRPSADFVHLADFTALRDGGRRLIDPGTLQGIITFPSFHACLAVLFAWGLWHNRATRWPGLACELLVLASTPIDGGHYLVDVIAGSLVALCALAAARRIVRSASATAEVRPAGQVAAALPLNTSPSRR